MARSQQFAASLGNYFGPSGTVTLVAGAGTVTAAMHASDVIMMTRQTSGGTLGTAETYTINSSVSFTIVSNNVLDTSVFAYLVVRK